MAGRPLAAAGGGSWSVDWPRADINLSVRLGELTRTYISKTGGEPNPLLVQLTDQQLTDLFKVARMPARARAAEKSEGDSVREWVAVFKAKRDEIVNHRCPS